MISCQSGYTHNEYHPRGYMQSPENKVFTGLGHFKKDIHEIDRLTGPPACPAIKIPPTLRPQSRPNNLVQSLVWEGLPEEFSVQDLSLSVVSVVRVISVYDIQRCFIGEHRRRGHCCCVTVLPHVTRGSEVHLSSNQSQQLGKAVWGVFLQEEGKLSREVLINEAINALSSISHTCPGVRVFGFPYNGSCYLCVSFSSQNFIFFSVMSYSHQSMLFI